MVPSCYRITMMKQGHDPDYPTPAMKELFAAVLKISSSDEATRFFRDLLTIAELKEFANRWAVVKCSTRAFPTKRLPSA